MRERARHPGLHDAAGNELPHRLVEVEGLSTYVVDAGAGPPIVLIHGYGAPADGGRRVVPGLMRDHRVIALDLPPFGRSDEIRSKRLIDFYKRFFPAFMERMGLERATIVRERLRRPGAT